MTVHVFGRVIEQSNGGCGSLDGIRETVGTLINAPAPGSNTCARALLHAVRLTCRRGGAIVSGSRCVSCPRFVNYRPCPDGVHVTIRCRWHGDDPVRALMRPAAALLAVPPDCTLAAADRLACDYHMRHLLVVDSGVLIGVLDLADTTELSRERPARWVMSRRLWITSPEATLADAVQILEGAGGDTVVVVEAHQLAGLITRDDLVDVGLLD